MEELAARTVRAVELLVEPLALLGLVVAGHVSALLQLVSSMSERAGVRVLTCSVELPELADLSLELELEALMLGYAGLLCLCLR